MFSFRRSFTNGVFSFRSEMKIEFLVSVLLCVSKVYSFQSSFIQDCLDAHNEYRARHGVPALSWSADIAVNAQKWANHLAAIDQLQHDSTTPDGENLFYMYGGDPEQACGRAVKNWYQEGKNYDFRSPHLDESTNHFSQLVWRDSKEVGIGTAQSKSGNFFLVARYSPRGNVDGKFNDNVPDITEQHSDVGSQEAKDNNQPNTTPVQGESSNTQPSKDQNQVFFKEVKYDPSTTGLESTTAPNLPPPQQADAESGTNQSPPLESGREPETSFSSSRPETHESENIQPNPNDGVNEMKQAPSSLQEGLTEPGSIINNADAGSTGLNEGPSSEISEPNRKLSSSEPKNSNIEAVQAAPLYEGSDVNSMNFRPHLNPGSEFSDSNPSYASSSPLEAKVRPGIEESSSAKEATSYERQEEKDARLETFAKLPMNDELPTKSEEPPSLTDKALLNANVPMKKPKNDGPPKSDKPPSLTYVLPEIAKISGKKPVPTLIKLPPAIALLTPKRGKDFRIEIRFTKIRYTDQMRVPGSLAFEEVKRNVTRSILDLFDDDDEFEEVQLISLRNGSVIATLGLLFKKDTPGHLNRLSLALLSGKLGSMAVAPRYLTAVALPAGYLRPNRPIQERPNVGVCAQPCSKPNICFPTGCSVTCCAFHPHKYHPPARVLPSVLPSCPGTCDDDCFPDCDADCCSGMMDADDAAPAFVSPVSAAPAAVAPVSASPSITCPGSCHFSCYPQCSPQCCATQYVQNPCHPSCPAYCAPSCDNACCAARKSVVNSLSRQYSRYRSAQRALARQLYLKKHLRLPFRRPKPVKLARPVRPRQRSYYLRRVKPESLGLEEYDRSTIHSGTKAQ
ncbi:uncharacterized protein LOC144644187 [Oculina patagonica]